VIKVAYVTTWDARDVHQWSGTGLSILRSLHADDIAIECIDRLEERHSLALKAKQLLRRGVFRETYLRGRSPVVTRGYADQIAVRLRHAAADIVFSPGTIPIAYLDCDKPIVFWTDATFAGLLDFYPTFSNLNSESVRDGNAAEQAALDRCALALYSSDWAAGTAVRHYSVDPRKIRVVPFGANLDNAPGLREVERFIDARPTGRCKLLFLGVDWFRKGGDIVLEAARRLNLRGLQTELTVVGCHPVCDGALPGFVRPLGFISKSQPGGAQRIARLLAETHFLFIPSRADCTPIVFGEANAFGVPCLTCDIGGARTMVTDDVNGYAFPPESPVDDYCDYICGCMADRVRYRRMALDAFGQYETRINWRVAGQTVRNLIRELLH
jgi:glycosyltransferase involved in cell wall biosynthesis